MGGNYINTTDDKVVSITAGIERRIAEHAKKNRKPAAQPKAAPVCENGVCRVTWKPQRPAA